MWDWAFFVEIKGYSLLYFWDWENEVLYEVRAILFYI